MRETVQVALGLGFVLVSILLIILAATRKYLPGKPWFIAFLAIGLINTLSWQVPALLFKLDIDFDISQFYDVFTPIMGIVNLTGFCMLIPFLFAMKEPPPPHVGEGVGSVSYGSHAYSGAPADTNDPLYGVAGWLKFFVIVHMYIAPVLFGLQQVIGFIAIGRIADRYPGLLVVGLIEAAVGIFLIVKWILIARRVRDVVPGVVQEVKNWLLITLAWGLISIPLIFLSGIDPEDLILDALKAFATAIISFSIWYSYFNVSKRVKATFPDWNGERSIMPSVP